MLIEVTMLYDEIYISMFAAMLVELIDLVRLKCMTITRHCNYP